MIDWLQALGGDRHQAHGPQRRQGHQLRPATAQLLGAEAGLAGIGPQLHLPQHGGLALLLGGDAGQPLGQGHGIQGVNRAEAAHHAPGLVGLQPADEMPVEGLQISQLVLLGGGLLQPALSEAALTRRHCGTDRRSGMPLAHRQQPAARRQLLPQALQPRGDGRGGHGQGPALR